MAQGHMAQGHPAPVRRFPVAGSGRVWSRAARGPVICRAGLALIAGWWSRLSGAVSVCRDVLPVGGQMFHHLDPPASQIIPSPSSPRPWMRSWRAGVRSAP